MSENNTQKRKEQSEWTPGHGPGGRHARMPHGKPKDAKKLLRRLWGYIKPELLGFSVIMLMVIISSVTTSIGSVLVGRIVDEGLVGGDASAFARYLIWLAVVYGLGVFSWWQYMFLCASVAQRVVKDIRKDLFERAQRLPLSYFDSHQPGDIMSRLTNDVDNISQAMSNSFTTVISSVVLVLASLAAMITTNGYMTLASLITLPLMAFISNAIAKRTRKYFSAQQAALGDINAHIEENITGARVVKLFCREGQQIEEFGKKNAALKDAGAKAQIFAGVIMPVMLALGNTQYVITAGLGGILALNGLISVGGIASFLMLTRSFTRPVNELASQFSALQAALAGAERAFEILDEPEESLGEESLTQITSVEGRVQFDKVDFSYVLGKPVLKGVSLDAPPGSMIALVGPTGAGKTTVINLLTRFYGVDSGSISVDNADIRGITRPSLRKRLSVVLQDPYLFEGTIRENIRYGRLDTTDEETEAAAKAVGIDAFIRALPEGYETLLTPEGSNVSQGQKQLLTIARAIIADPDVLILDEATSSVDTRTEMQLQKAMRTLMKGRTSFVIAHRLSTIRDADQILFITGGEVVERGTHRELYAKKGRYYELYQNASIRD